MLQAPGNISAILILESIGLKPNAIKLGSPNCWNLKASFEIPLPHLPAILLNLMAVG